MLETPTDVPTRGLTLVNTALEDLATQIRGFYDAAMSAARTTIASARACGEKLAEAKALLPHGEWLPWVTANFDGSERTAQKWMQIAATADTLPLDVGAGITAALDAIALPRTVQVKSAPRAHLASDVETSPEVAAQDAREGFKRLLAAETNRNYAIVQAQLDRERSIPYLLNDRDRRAVEKTLQEFERGVYFQAAALEPAQLADAADRVRLAELAASLRQRRSEITHVITLLEAAVAMAREPAPAEEQS